MVPERDSSLYECFPPTTNGQIYQTFRPLRRGSTSSAISVPNLTALANTRHNSNSSSNEADEDFSSSSMNSNPTINGTDDNGIGIYMTPSLSISTTNMSTFKCSSTTTTTMNSGPSKPSEVKRRSNHRKQIYAALNCNQHAVTAVIPENETPILSVVPPPPPPPPPPLPKEKPFASPSTNRPSNFQEQIEQAKSRLKKVHTDTSSNVNGKENPRLPPAPQKAPSPIYDLAEVKNIIIEDRTNVHEFPPPPSPSTLHRPIHSGITDPRLDANFSSVIAQRAAASKARRHDHLTDLEQQSHGLPPSTTFFNSCVTTNRMKSPLTTNSKYIVSRMCFFPLNLILLSVLQRYHHY